MVKRRKMLIGMGALAAGSGAALGTGATNNFDVNDRSTSINVVADGNTGVIGLLDRTSGDIVNTDGNKKLEIDFAEYGASDGVPKDSVIELGNTGNPTGNAIPSNEFSPGTLGDNAAFAVANYAAGQDLEFEFEYTAGNNFNVNEQGSRLNIGYRVVGNDDRDTAKVADFSPAGWSDAPYTKNASPGDTIFTNTVEATLSPGETIEFGVTVNTGGDTNLQGHGYYDGSGVSINENLSGELSFSATQV
jgi:hypothetical protein